MYFDFQEYIPTCHICLHIIRHIRMRYLQSNGAVGFAQRVCRYAGVHPYVRLLGINHLVCSNLPNMWKQIGCRSWPGSPWYVAASLCCTLSSFPPTRYTSHWRLFCHQGCDFILSAELLVLKKHPFHHKVINTTNPECMVQSSSGPYPWKQKLLKDFITISMLTARAGAFFTEMFSF